MQNWGPHGPRPKHVLSLQKIFILTKYHMFRLSYESFFILCKAFFLKRAISSHSNCGISSVAQHNPHINAIFVYLFMQELFVDKIHFFKFLSISVKPRLHQLNIISSSRSTVHAFLTAWMLSPAWENTIKEGVIPYVENKYKSTQTYQVR